MFWNECVLGHCLTCIYVYKYETGYVICKWNGTWIVDIVRVEWEIYDYRIEVLNMQGLIYCLWYMMRLFVWYDMCIYIKGNSERHLTWKGGLIKVFGAWKVIENDIGFSYDETIWFWKITKVHMVFDNERWICVT